MSTMSKRRPSIDSQVVTLVATSRLPNRREEMRQYAPQLGTRIGLTGQFVANGRDPWTPAAVRAGARDDDDRDDGEPLVGEEAAAVTPEAGLRSPGAVDVAGRAALRVRR